MTRVDDGFGVRAGFLIHDVSRLRRAFFDSAMRPYGLTRSQWWVLGQLSRRRGEPMSQVELAKHLDLGKASLGGQIDRLYAEVIENAKLPRSKYDIVAVDYPWYGEMAS
jgi:hypothetical protein